MLELSDKYFKAPIIKILQLAIMNFEDIGKQIEKSQFRTRNTLKKVEVHILELKNAIVKT